MQFPKALSYSFAITLLITPNLHATSDLSTAEKNTMIKEEVAAAQVMQEICPSLLGKNAKFDHNMQSLISDYLVDYSDKTITLEKLQSDAEYKSLILDVRKAAQEASQEENKVVCEEILTIEM